MNLLQCSEDKGLKQFQQKAISNKIASANRFKKIYKSLKSLLCHFFGADFA
jgi:hypothetical protein